MLIHQFGRTQSVGCEKKLYFQQKIPEDPVFSKKKGEKKTFAT